MYKVVWLIIKIYFSLVGRELDLTDFHVWTSSLWWTRGWRIYSLIDWVSVTPQLSLYGLTWPVTLEAYPHPIDQLILTLEVGGLVVRSVYQTKLPQQLHPTDFCVWISSLSWARGWRACSFVNLLNRPTPNNLTQPISMYEPLRSYELEVRGLVVRLVYPIDQP